MHKLLIVDDEAPIRDMMAMFAQDLGFIPVLASDGDVALQMFRQEYPPIVLTDVRMPKMDGITFTQRLKEESPETYVIMLTGHGGEETAIETKVPHRDGIEAAPRHQTVVVRTDAGHIRQAETAFVFVEDGSLLDFYVVEIHLYRCRGVVVDTKRGKEEEVGTTRGREYEQPGDDIGWPSRYHGNRGLLQPGRSPASLWTRLGQLPRARLEYDFDFMRAGHHGSNAGVGGGRRSSRPFRGYGVKICPIIGSDWSVRNRTLAPEE